MPQVKNKEKLLQHNPQQLVRNTAAFLCHIHEPVRPRWRYRVGTNLLPVRWHIHLTVHPRWQGAARYYISNNTAWMGVVFLTNPIHETH
jgi:hypothetical protein